MLSKDLLLAFARNLKITYTPIGLIILRSSRPRALLLSQKKKVVGRAKANKKIAQQQQHNTPQRFLDKHVVKRVSLRVVHLIVWMSLVVVLSTTLWNATHRFRTRRRATANKQQYS